MSGQFFSADLAQLSIFRGLTSQDLFQIDQLLIRKKFPQATTLLMAGYIGSNVYIVLDGTVKICAEGDMKGDLIVALCGPGEILGEVSALDGQGHSASVITREPTIVGVLNRGQYLRILEEIPLFSINVMLSMARRLRMATTHLQSMAVDDIPGQVARQLLAFAQAHGKLTPKGEILIPFRLTQQDLADTIGASRVRVQQVLAEYEEIGYIRTGRCVFTGHPFRITICKPAALRSRCFQHHNF